MIREKLIFKVPIEVDPPVELCSTEGLAMIAALETAYSATMSDIQKERVCTWYNLMKGEGTTNGSDILSLLASTGAVLYPQIPLNDSTATAAAYAIDAISQTTLGTFNNFLAGDITPTGVIGGTTKYFDSGVAPNAFIQNNVQFSVYCRNIPTSNTNNGSYESGTTLRFLSNIRTSNDFTQSINVPSGGKVNSGANGLIGAGRDSSVNEYGVRNGVRINDFSSGSVSANIYNIYFHAQNGAGALIGSGGDSELCMYMMGAPTFTANELADFYEAMQWLQTNIITGGRNV